MSSRLLYPLSFALLPSILVGLVALPFTSAQTVIAACLLAYAIVIATEFPVHLFLHRQQLQLTLSLRLMAVIMRLLFAVVCVSLCASAYTEAFILIFCVTLSLTIMVDAALIVYRSQEPVHA